VWRKYVKLVNQNITFFPEFSNKRYERIVGNALFKNDVYKPNKFMISNTKKQFLSIQ